ncbi:hypothetical protein [Alteromonas sp. a30]|uniref:hypothetical protein n=1 Tax=Alteromonas sp. a30 TaxID=2730917 RepID=UPI00227FC141|nr:hypothetical protein [Alteromonas sp. a30]MCY7297298.1 hypothetical protein [Alteromonas sp. a30]
MKVNIEGIENYSSLKEAIASLQKNEVNVEITYDGDIEKLVLKPKAKYVNIPLQKDGAVSVKHFEEYVRKQGFKVAKRERRSKGELPHPELSSGSEKNRKDTKLQARVSCEFAEKVSAFCERTGMQKKDLVETAVGQFIDGYDPK